jgi:hypothetical protein
MRTIDSSVIDQLALAQIEKVTFFKRDEIATDLICCEVQIGGKAWTFHEEIVGWSLLLQHLEKLPRFRADWFSAVSQPPFAASKTVAYSREN